MDPSILLNLHSFHLQSKMWFKNSQRPLPTLIFRVIGIYREIKQGDLKCTLTFNKNWEGWCSTSEFDLWPLPS